MGCDIHEFQEKRINGVWVTADTWEKDKYWDGDGEQRLERIEGTHINVGRNYDLFGLLAGVRRVVEGSFEPKGIPDDVSLELKANYESWGVDAHTPSWLTLKELKEKSMELLLVDNWDDRWIRGGLTHLINQMISDMPPEDVRFVFWFDN